MKEVKFYKKINKNEVQCNLCPWNCKIKNQKVGFCKTRKNIDGKLFSLIYSKPCSVSVDPVEKKPLYHFLPGSSSFSIGFPGCNLHCAFCQNCEISQANPEEIRKINLPPELAVNSAIKAECKSISYTYTEPLINAEYIIDTAKIARKARLKNVIVSNGFINKEPLLEVCKFIDAANIDLKSFQDEFYKKVTNSWIKPVLNSLKVLKEKKVWLEITNLMIPGYNDDMKNFEEMCKWIKMELSEDIPLHISRFFPYYKFINIEATPLETLEKAGNIARKHLNYVYMGNTKVDNFSNTYCPKCKELFIKREGLQVRFNKTKLDSCDHKKEIPGVW